MIEGTANSVADKAPLHLWVVGIVSLLWNAMGAADYTMTHVGGAEYLAAGGFGNEVLAWFAAIPLWTTAAWALGVWGAVAGSVLLLMRSRHAVFAFAVSLVGVIALTLSSYFVHPYPAEMRSPAMAAFEWTIKLVAVVLLIYAVKMRARGVLR